MAVGSLGKHPKFIYKAYGNSGATILVPHDYAGRVSSVKYIGTDGNEIDTSYVGGNYAETGADKYNLNRTANELPPGKVVVTLDDGTVLDQDITTPTNDFRSGQETSPQSMNSGPGSSGGYPSAFSPGSIGYGSIPTYLGDQYPSPVFSQFKGIKAPNIQNAPYQFIDPQAFASSFGSFNRGEYVKNAQLSKSVALDQLDTELQGLQGYAPAAAALKRSETAADNAFNQSQRTAQVNQALPNAQGDLEAQRQRSNTYASGRLPDSITDRSLELGVRSAAADNASAGGFGTGSVAAANVSDLMSADKRFAISQYGEGLISSNLRDSSALLLAPTEYSNAGGQISVMPSLSGSQLASNALKDINALTTLDPGQALNSAVNQEQFGTNILQRTNEFNASNLLQAKEFNSTGRFNASQVNAGIANQFSLGKFAYDVSYAGVVAGAGQANTNTMLGLQQQAQYASIFKDMFGQAQAAQQTGAITQGITAIAGIVSSLANLFVSSDTTGKTKAANPDGTISTQGPELGPSIEDAPTVGPSIADAPTVGPEPLPPGTHSDADGMTVLDEGNPMPPGYESVQKVDAGDVIQPTADSQMNLQGFARDLKINPETLKSQTGKIVPQAAALLNTMGITSKPQQGSVPIGFSNSGKPLFANQTVLRSQDTSLGAKTVNTFQQVMDPFGVFKGADATNLQKIGTVASDVGFIAQLTDQYNRGDKAGFVTSIVNKFGPTLVDKNIKDQGTKDALGTAFSAYNLYNQWGQASGAQKGIGLANLGLSAYKTVTGKNLASTAIIEATPGNPGLNVGQALGLFSAGYNVYSLAKNWNQLNTLQKVAAGSGDAAQIANLAQSFKLLGSGTNGAAANAASQGASAEANAASQGGTAASSGAAGVSFAEVAGAAGVAAGAYQVYNSWGKGGKQNTIAGAAGGTAIAGGLYAMGATNPYVLGGIVAASALGANVKSKESQRGAALGAASAIGLVTGGTAFLSSNVRDNLTESFKSGKSEEQAGRDAVRKNLQRLGSSDSSHSITLADGTKADIGADGHSGSHTVSDPSKWVGKAPSSLHSYDVDYTNDLDYTAALGGISLSRITSGGKNTSIDQVGSQIGNATLKNVGKGFSAQNFSTLAQNQRAVYAQSGIKSKADAYALAQQAYREGRIDATDLVTAQNSFNMIYDSNGYDTAQKLMAGRFRGIEVAAKDPAPKSDVAPIKSTQLSKPISTSALPSNVIPITRPTTRMLLTKEAAIAKNKKVFGSLSQRGVG